MMLDYIEHIRDRAGKLRTHLRSQRIDESKPVPITRMRVKVRIEDAEEMAKLVEALAYEMRRHIEEEH